MVKKKKETEPQYLNSVTNMPTYNYRVYHMKKLEKLMYFVIAFSVGAMVGYLFYGGIGKNEYGDPTAITYFLNITIPSIIGAAAGIAFVPIRRKQIIAKHKKKISGQFRDMLEALDTSLGAGKNVTDSFYAVYDDMKRQYEEDAHIIEELEVILSGIANNFPIEQLLEDFGKRTDNEDIQDFANVFNVCYRKGGNIKDTVRNTHAILSEKMEIAEDIETLVTSNKLEQNLMLVIPVALIGVIKLMSPEFAENFTTPTGIASTTIAIIIFVISYFVGKAVLNIKI